MKSGCWRCIVSTANRVGGARGGYHCSAIQHNVARPAHPPIPPFQPGALTHSGCFIVTVQLPAVLNQSLTVVAKYGAWCPPSPYQTFRGLPSRNHSREGWRPLINAPVTQEDSCRGHRLSVIRAGCQGADCQGAGESGTIRRRVIYDV